MIEQLRHRADTIKTVIGQQPERGMDLLLDFARAYSVDEDVENEILLCQYALNTANTEGGKVLELLTAKLYGFADAIVDDYDAAKVEARFERERALAEAIRQQEIRRDVVLVANNIVKSRGNNFTLTVEHLELQLGQVTGLVGENATGKTTLLNILAGELALQEGRVTYPLFDPKNRKNWTDLKMRIAHVPQELPEWEGSLLENLAFEAARYGIKGQKNKDAVAYIIQRLGLALHTNKTWQQLSGGYKLRFALAKALVWQPQLLILDEPFASLDIKTEGVVLTDLRSLAGSLKNPMAVIVSSHHLFETEAVADQMWFMRGGTLENLSNTADFNKERDYNLFELSCNASFILFNQAVNPLIPLKTWREDAIYFIKTPLSINAEKLLDTLFQHNIQVAYFRDISQSVKVKFYNDKLD